MIKEPPRFTEKDLGNWKLLRSFRQCLDAAFESYPPEGSWVDPKRRLQVADYLSLFLFGLLNPVTQTLRGISAASLLPRTQREVCSQTVPRSTFSDAQHVLDPRILEKVFADFSEKIPQGPTDPHLSQWRWLARDGSLFRALPRMAWAMYGGGAAGHVNRAARLHLSLHIFDDKPTQVDIRPGRVCERAVWEDQLEVGAGYIADRYFGENYRLFAKLHQKGCTFVLRVLDNAIINVEEELPVSEEDRSVGVVRQAKANLGCRPRVQSMSLRVVWIQTQDGMIVLVTNIDAQTLSAHLIAELYRKRWKIELFFRWVKCILGCGHWMAESQRGVTIQIYLALIAALILQLYAGRRPNKRMMELIRFYLMGWCNEAELEKGLIRYRQELERRKNS